MANKTELIDSIIANPKNTATADELNKLTNAKLEEILSTLSVDSTKTQEAPKVPTATIAKVPEVETKVKTVLVQCVEDFKGLFILGNRYSMRVKEQRQVPEDVAYILKESRLVI
jgi:hypothetical protein